MAKVSGQLTIAATSMGELDRTVRLFEKVLRDARLSVVREERVDPKRGAKLEWSITLRVSDGN